MRLPRPLVLASALVLVPGSFGSTAPPPPTITFLVASDSHFGARGMSDLNRSVVEQMNALPGTEYPPAMGGQVDTPRGVLFTGDTTDNGRLDEFAEFEGSTGRTGGTGCSGSPSTWPSATTTSASSRRSRTG